MKSQQLIRCAVPMVLGAMNRASKAIRRGEGVDSPMHQKSRAHHVPAAESTSSSFAMPCFAQLAAERGGAAAPGVGAEGHVSLRQLRAAVESCLRTHAPIPRDVSSSRTPDLTEATSVGSAHEEAPAVGASDEVLLDALEGYDPTLDPALVRRAAQRVGAAPAIEQARRLLDLIHEQAERSGHGTIRDEALLGFVRLVHRWRAERQAQLRRRLTGRETKGGSAATVPEGAAATARLAAEAAQWRLAEEEVGIFVRLHIGQGTSRQRLDGVLADVGDLQVNEVLPGGDVVTLTRPTLPEEETAVEWKGKHRHNLVTSLESLFATSSASPPRSVVYLHFVLYKEGVRLSELIRFLCRVVGDALVQPSDFSVHQVLEEKAVTVQSCALRVEVPPAVLAVEGGAVDYCRHIARRLLEVNVASATPTPSQPREAESAAITPVAIQLLEWLPAMPGSAARPSAAEGRPVAAGAQYSFLIRGVCPPRGSPPHHVEKAVQRSLAAIPNFFAPVHFGALGDACPFKAYHVSAALAHGRWAEGLVMAVVLAMWPADAVTPAPAWVATVLTALASGEDRAAVLRALWQTQVPHAVQSHFSAASSALLWNILASCRLHEWKRLKTGKDVGIVDADLASVGDFVVADDARILASRSAVQSQVPSGKSEAVLAAPEITVATRGAQRGPAPAVRPLLTTPSGATAPHMTAVAIPFLENDLDLACCPAVRALGVALGLLPAASVVGVRGERQVASVPRFRPLLLQGRGYPQAAWPWIKAFPEPPQWGLEASPVYHLATDLTLARTRGASRDFASASRGSQGIVWPLGQRGRSMVERLPAGLLAATSLSAPGRRGVATTHTRSSRAPPSLSWCVALHVTLPAAAYPSDFLRECLTLRDCRPHARNPLGVLASRLGVQLAEDGASEDPEVTTNTTTAASPSPMRVEDDEKEGGEGEVDGNLLDRTRRRG